MTKGEKLTRLREGRAYAEIARAVMCSAPTVREIESGKTADPAGGLMLRLARFYGVPVEWLLDDSADWPPPPSADERIVLTVREALEAAGAGATDETERELLAAYRKSTPEGRDRIIGYAVGMAASNAPGSASLSADVTAALESSRRRQAAQGRRAAPADRKRA